MTNIEKKMLVLATLALIAFGFCIYSLHTSIEDAGGPKQIIIDAGREIKDIAEKIAE